MQQRVDLATRQEATLLEFLSHRARSASDGRLALDAGGGLILAAIAAIVRPAAWVVLVPLGFSFLAFGLWGIVDRELSERRANLGWLGIGVLTGARATAGILGAVAAVVLIYAAAALTLGRWVS